MKNPNEQQKRLENLEAFVSECAQDDLDRISPGLKNKAKELLAARRMTHCPQCSETVIQCRYTGDYCEECGWPDENRGEQ